MFFTHVSIQDTQQTRRSVGVVFDWLDTSGHAATLPSSNIQHAGMVQGLTEEASKTIF